MTSSPVGFLAQLVERCTGIAEVMSSTPVRALIFFRSYFNYQFSSVHNCEDLLYSFLHRSAHTWFSYIYSQYFKTFRNSKLTTQLLWQKYIIIT